MGSHVHLSIWQGDQNVLMGKGSGSKHGMSKQGQEFMAGVLHHLPAIFALTCPIPNRYLSTYHFIYCSLELSFNGPLAHGVHPTFQKAKDPPASWGATFSWVSDDLIMLWSLNAGFYMVV